MNISKEEKSVIGYTAGRTWSLWAVAGWTAFVALRWDDLFWGLVAAATALLAASLSGWIAGRWHQQAAANRRVRRLLENARAGFFGPYGPANGSPAANENAEEDSWR
jgi:hypothetical protein